MEPLYKYSITTAGLAIAQTTYSQIYNKFIW